MIIITFIFSIAIHIKTGNLIHSSQQPEKMDGLWMNSSDGFPSVEIKPGSELLRPLLSWNSPRRRHTGSNCELLLLKRLAAEENKEQHWRLCLFGKTFLLQSWLRGSQCRLRSLKRKSVGKVRVDSVQGGRRSENQKNNRVAGWLASWLGHRLKYSKTTTTGAETLCRLGRGVNTI